MRLCTLITINDNLRAEAPRSFLSSNASTRDQILLQINQIKILVYTVDYWDPLLLRMTNNGEGKWTTIQEKLKIPAQGLPWKQINFLSSETRDVCSVNLFTNEWLHKLERKIRNTAVNYSWVYALHSHADALRGHHAFLADPRGKKRVAISSERVCVGSRTYVWRAWSDIINRLGSPCRQRELKQKLKTRSSIKIRTQKQA